MKSAPRRCIPRPALKFALAAALGMSLGTALAPPARAATALDLYYERAVMSAADSRCRLFAPELGSALASFMAQARGAALRAGADDGALAQITASAAARAAAMPCGAPDLAKAAGRVRGAFEGYGRLIRLNLPGDVASWRADRTAPSDSAGWRLSQAAMMGAAPLTLGLEGRRGETPRLSAVMDFGDGPEPYTARILVRDQGRAPRPYLDLLRVSATTKVPLSARIPPRSAERAFAAEARGPADSRLLPAGVKSATAFSFPATAQTAIAGLDPREAITLEFVFAGRTGDVTRQALIEVGDFAAGEAFINVSRR